MAWEPATFMSAWGTEAAPQVGYVYKGLGLYMAMKASQKGRRPARWCLVHLNSGHAIGWVTGDVATAFPIASDVADLTDWDFEGVDGWRNRDPDLPKKVHALSEAHPKRLEVRGGTPNHDAARAVLASRAAA